jgi:hypothetical protein
VNGIGNIADVIDSPDSMIRLNGIGNVATNYIAIGTVLDPSGKVIGSIRKNDRAVMSMSVWLRM